jgi:hypothetical protein
LFLARVCRVERTDRCWHPGCYPLLVERRGCVVGASRADAITATGERRRIRHRILRRMSRGMSAIAATMGG